MRYAGRVKSVIEKWEDYMMPKDGGGRKTRSDFGYHTTIETNIFGASPDLLNVATVMIATAEPLKVGTEVEISIRTEDDNRCE